MEEAEMEQEELADRLLERVRLLDVARGRTHPFLRSRWRIMANVLLIVVGWVMIAQAIPRDAIPDRWPLLVGIGLMALGVGLRYDPSEDRLDALIRFLDDKGQLAVVDETTTIKKSTVSPK